MTNERLEPLPESAAAVDAFLDTLDLATIQRAWDRQVARLRFVVLPPLDDDDE
jgi:hypothetical protein